MIRGLTQDVEILSSGVGSPRGCEAVEAERRQDQAEPCNSAHPNISVIGVICAGDLATHRDTIKQALKRGIEQRPDAVWVCIEPKSDRLTHDLMISLDIEPVVLPMLDAWKHKGTEQTILRPTSGAEGLVEDVEIVGGYDFRRVWRDLEMLSLCDELIVFHKRSGNSPWRDRDASGLYADKLVVVELGKEKPKAKKAA